MTTCAHCFRETTDEFRCKECGLAIVCKRCAREMGLLGSAEMLAVEAEKRKKEEQKEWDARKAKKLKAVPAR